MIEVSAKEAAILQFHYAGKPHTAIAHRFGVSTGFIRDLVLRAADGYKVREDWKP